MYLIPLLLFIVMQGRSYYLAPAYPMLIGAGAVMWGQWVAVRPVPQAHLIRGITWMLIVVGGVIGIVLFMPIAPINSDVWDITSEMHDGFVEQIGWQELTQTVASIYETLPDEEQAHTGILTGNYGRLVRLTCMDRGMGSLPLLVGLTPIICVATAIHHLKS